MDESASELFAELRIFMSVKDELMPPYIHEWRRRVVAIGFESAKSKKPKGFIENALC